MAIIAFWPGCLQTGCSHAIYISKKLLTLDCLIQIKLRACFYSIIYLLEQGERLVENNKTILIIILLMKGVLVAESAIFESQFLVVLSKGSLFVLNTLMSFVIRSWAKVLCFTKKKKLLRRVWSYLCYPGTKRVGEKNWKGGKRKAVRMVYGQNLWVVIPLMKKPRVTEDEKNFLIWNGTSVE